MHAEADTPSSEGQQRRHQKNIIKTDYKYKKQKYSSRRPKYTRDRNELIRLGKEERRGGDGPVILRKGKDVTPLRLIYRKHLDLPRNPQLDKPAEQPADLNLAISDTTSIATNTLQEMMNRPPAQIRYTTEAVMEWTEKDAKNRDYTIELSETGTISLFHIPTEYVSELDEEKELHAKIKANNKRHAKVSLLSGDPDICSSAAVQTYNNLSQSQGTQTQKRENADVGIQVTSWQIHDERDVASEYGSSREAEALTRESAFTVVERAVIQNLAAPLQRMYRVQDVRENNTGTQRNEFDSEDERSDDGAEKGETKLRHLWCFATEELQNKEDGSRQSVTCLTQPGDLLCAGYGSTVFGNKNEGQIRLWTLKNMYHPERTYNLSKGVTSVNFSTIHPYLLAAGLYDGAVCIYDIRSSEDKPVLRSNMGAAKHSSAVWEVIWGKSEVSHTSHEQLYSISSDGAVKQWSMKKGFVSTDIMSLKRVPNQASQLGKKSSNTIRSRQASGMCFDFPKNDPTWYYVGTEDGIVHKCSVSYNEQVLRTYFGHQGPVYKIRCHSWIPDIFVTCSQDWTVKIWDQSEATPISNLCSGNDYVMDVQWSPFDSCVFASCSLGKRINVWNLAVSKKDPVIQHSQSEMDAEFTSIGFSPGQSVTATPTLFAGRDDGVIDVYRIEGDFCFWSADDQFARAKKHVAQRVGSS